MAFHDDLARDPKSEEEFWAIIEDTFVQIEAVLTTYRVETKEEACLMTFRAEKARRTAERGWLPSRQRRGSDREYADRLTGRARV